MAVRCVFKSAFVKAFDKLVPPKQLLVTKALEALQSYFKSGQASYGLRIKKLYKGNKGKVLEARVSIDLRIVWVQTSEEIVFALVGSHDEVRRFLKNL